MYNKGDNRDLGNPVESLLFKSQDLTSFFQNCWKHKSKEVLCIYNHSGFQSNLLKSADFQGTKFQVILHKEILTRAYNAAKFRYLKHEKCMLHLYISYWPFVTSFVESSGNLRRIETVLLMDRLINKHTICACDTNTYKFCLWIGINNNKT